MAQRALLTDTEREILTGERDVKDNYRYSVESRVRQRIEKQLGEDLRVLADHPELFEAAEQAFLNASAPQADGPDDLDSPAGQDDVDEPARRADEEDRSARDDAGSGDFAGLLDEFREYLTDRPPKTTHGREAVVTTLAVLREDGPLKTSELQDRVFGRLDSDEWGDARAMWQSIQRYMGDVDDPVAGIEKVAYGEWDYAGDDELRGAISHE